jgi:hypothetical protein
MHLFLLLALAAAPAGWSQTAERDLSAMHQAILENHPGPVDALNPGFGRWLEAGYQKALARAQSVQDFAGYLAALRSYQAGFRDGHLGLRFDGPLPEAGWPGFLASLREGVFRVLVAEPDAGIPTGAELVDCDGKSPRTLMGERVFPFRGNPALEASWTRFAPELVIDRGVPETAPLPQCHYRLGQKLETASLRYRAISEAELAKKQEQASFGPPPAFGVRPFGSDGLWVSIPRFAGPDTLPQLEKLVADAPSWRRASRIVFDLRGNDGGDSAWGTRILEALYGKAYVEQVVEPKVDPPREYVEWRASKGNLEYLGTLVARLAKEAGPGSDETREFDGVRRQMREAVGTKQSLVPERSSPPGRRARLESPVHARVLVVTDGRCASACLDFVDELLVLPESHQLGWPTSADSTYLELRPIPLPGGHAQLLLAMKVYRNRLRGDNEPYTPFYRFHGEIADTPALEQFVSRVQLYPAPR